MKHITHTVHAFISMRCVYYGSPVWAHMYMEISFPRYFNNHNAHNRQIRLQTMASNNVSLAIRSCISMVYKCMDCMRNTICILLKCVCLCVCVWGGGVRRVVHVVISLLCFEWLSLSADRAEFL